MARALPEAARTPGGAPRTARSIELRRGVPDTTGAASPGAAMAGSAATTRARLRTSATDLRAFLDKAPLLRPAGKVGPHRGTREISRKGLTQTRVFEELSVDAVVDIGEDV